jgi:hypothetical protein
VASIDEALGAARQHARDTLATITAANGYAVEIKTTDGGMNENALKTPDSQFPRCWVYSNAARVGRPINAAIGSVTAPATADIWFILGDKAGNGVVSSLLRLLFGRNKATGEEHDAYLGAVVKAFEAAIPPAGTRVFISADRDAVYSETTGGRAILQVPLTIEATYSRS